MPCSYPCLLDWNEQIWVSHVQFEFPPVSSRGVTSRLPSRWYWQNSIVGDIFLVNYLLQVFSPVAYFRFPRRLFNTNFLAGCLLQVFSLVVYFRFSHWLFISGFFTSCSFQVFHQMFISDFLAGCLLQIFSPVIRLLLTHQSSVDALACLFAIILLVQPLNWIPGVNILDDIICHLWDAQYIYWTAVCISREFLFRSAPILVHMSSLPLQAWIISATI